MEQRQKIIEIAEANLLDDDTHIDTDPKISISEDNGAWIQAWIFVSFEGTELDGQEVCLDENPPCPSCGKPATGVPPTKDWYCADCGHEWNDEPSDPIERMYSDAFKGEE